MERLLFPAIPVFLILALPIGCTPGGVPPAPGGSPEARAALDREYARLVQKYNRETGARQIGVDAVKEKLRRGEPVVFLDIREEEEYAVSALPGARHIPPGRAAEKDLDLPPGAAVITYCTAGYRSGLAAVALEERLGREVLNLEGGIIAWFNSGGEVIGPDGEPAGTIHPYGPEWQRYVHPR